MKLNNKSPIESSSNWYCVLCQSYNIKNRMKHMKQIHNINRPFDSRSRQNMKELLFQPHANNTSSELMT